MEESGPSLGTSTRNPKRLRKRGNMSSSSQSPTSIIQRLFEADLAIRYVALYIDGTLSSSERPGLTNASASESDKYEELIVNPTLLKLVQQRGEIDCGGAKYVLVRYGNFYQYVQALKQGHISVGIQPDANLIQTVSAIQTCVASTLS